MHGLLSQTVIGALSLLSAHASDGPRRPFPQHLTYAAGTIRPDHHSQASIDDDVRAFYAWWKRHYLAEAGQLAGGPAYRVCLGKHGSGNTVSEGQGYGLIIVALMAGDDPDAKSIFDGLLAYALAHPSTQSPALMAWKIPAAKRHADSAFDGDADIAYALMLADAQWGSDGRTSYRNYARKRLAALRRSVISGKTHLPLLGDWVHSNNDDIDETMGRTSDFMPAHFASFARFTRDRSWKLAAVNTRAAMTRIQSTLSPLAGLVPDFVTHLDQAPQAARPHFLESKHDGSYFTNAARVSWRIGTDALLNGDPASFAQARKVSTWIEHAVGGDPQAIRAGYALDGSALKGGKYFSDLYAAPFGVAAMTNPAQQVWLNALYDAVRDHHEGYYEDSVALLSLLVMTGNYWDPT